jgi:hypothetical protein
MGNEEKSKIPSYWRQKETRQRQISIQEEPHPELKEHLARETKEIEEKKREVHRRKLTLPEKIIIIIGLAAVIALFIFIFK